MHELVEVAHYRSAAHDGAINKTAFMEVVNGYKRVGPIIDPFDQICKYEAQE